MIYRIMKNGYGEIYIEYKIRNNDDYEWESIGDTTGYKITKFFENEKEAKEFLRKHHEDYKKSIKEPEVIYEVNYDENEEDIKKESNYYDDLGIPNAGYHAKLNEVIGKYLLYKLKKSNRGKQK